MAISEEDKISMKIVRQKKQCGAKKFLKEFPQKGWSFGGLKKIIRDINTTGTAARCPGSARRRIVCTVTVGNINDVHALVLSQDDNPRTHRTQKQISCELGISKPSVNLCPKCLEIEKEDLQQTYHASV